ncbi:AAA family ATPase [candidate division KSB1 bacterium]|nr:AAA family ATPase [candidate division KSB1 bacterium]
MQFRIADTFTDSLVRLSGQVQKAVKTTAFDLQMNPANPGMKFHKIDRCRDRRFWSVRVNQDIRLIVHKTGSSLMLCYVDHHDAAYRWAQQRKLETHPKTGAAQLVKIREIPRTVVLEEHKRFCMQELSEPSLLNHVSDERLLSYGVPGEWIESVRQADENSILELAEQLPAEAAEAVLDLAVGEAPPQPATLPPETDPFDHPDAQRRFRVMEDVEELKRALDYPWEKWTIFLHPAQRALVEKKFNGPARISGSAGTGKTVVALHRAVYLARQYPHARILLATFSDTLAKMLQIKLHRLIRHQPRLTERIEVCSMPRLGLRLYKLHLAMPHIANRREINEIMQKAAESIDNHKFTLSFLLNEWNKVVDAWELQSWKAYRDVLRLGRKTRLPESQRKILWSVFEAVRTELDRRGVVTFPQLFHQLTDHYAQETKSPYDFVVIDEAQDISIAQLRFLAALKSERPDNLFFTGDLGQRIFQQPFSWKALGTEITGRSHTLRINYRTSHQIRTHADRLLEPELSDVDGNVEKRSGTISVFNGPVPIIQTFPDQEAEIKAVSEWLSKRFDDDVKPEEIGVFVRSQKILNRAIAVLKTLNLQYHLLDQASDSDNKLISVGTMHTAKGLEFRAIVVMACDDEIIPLQDRIETVTDESDLQEVYNTERHLLYVACTRARDYLLLTGVEPVSEFLGDMGLCD